MDLKSLRSKVRLYIQEPVADRFTDDEINSEINDAYEDLFLKIDRTNTVRLSLTPYINQYKILIPDDIKGIKQVEIIKTDGKKVKITKTDFDTFYRILYDREVWTTKPPSMCIIEGGNILRLDGYVQSDYDYMKLSILDVPQLLINDTDVPIFLTAYHKLLAYRAAFMLLNRDGRQDEATTYVALYEDLLDSFMESNNNLEGICLLYTSPSPRDLSTSRMPSSA